MTRTKLPGVLVFLGLSVALASSSHADDACASFTWDVRHERALFAQEATSLVAGSTLATAPTLAADRLYQLELKSQAQVKLVAPPGNKKQTDGMYAGLARLRVDTPGKYRIALDQGFWIDLLVNGSPVRAEAFQGRPGCNAPHKIVEFVLPAGTPITLQLSGGNGPSLRVTLTRSPEG